MLNSKEVLEQTGISRATLNNYISTGLIPRPEVLPPNPQDGAAPRIGYFPDETVARIADIQRLKREGWSISRIAAHFAGGGQGRPDTAPTSQELLNGPRALPRPLPATGSQEAARVEPSPSRATLPLTDIPHPAYLLDRGLELVWANDAARSNPASPMSGVLGDAPMGAVAQRLLSDSGDSSAALLRFHLGLLKQRGGDVAELARGLTSTEATVLGSAYRDCAPVSAEPFAQLQVRTAGASMVLQAAQFREGILFVLVPASEGQAVQEPPVHPSSAARPAPALMPVAVLMATLQDAHSLWLRLPAADYFELVNDVWTELDTIFRSLGGHHSSHPGDGMVCYFLAAADDGYLTNALTAAHRIREAMRQLSGRWQARKGWDVELCMNTGIAAGQDWIGPLRLTEPVELSVLGAAADHAGALSRTARGGAIWITRGLVDLLGAAARQRLQYGVPRRGSEAGQPRVLASFARLQDLAAGAHVPPALADLPATELFDLALPGPNRNPGQAPA